MKTQNNPMQLEMSFDQSYKDLEQAVERFRKAASGFAAAAPPFVSKQPATALRAAVRRIIGVLVDQSGLSFHTVWVLAYHELYEASGFHAVAAGGGDPMVTFLDMVERSGKMEQLLEVLMAMLKKPEYRKS